MRDRRYTSQVAHDRRIVSSSVVTARAPSTLPCALLRRVLMVQLAVLLSWSTANIWDLFFKL